jgi:hypothetical protein
MSPDQIGARLMEVAHERLQADWVAMKSDGAHAARWAESAGRPRRLVGAAVTELAMLSGQLHGRNQG